MAGVIGIARHTPKTSRIVISHMSDMSPQSLQIDVGGQYARDFGAVHEVMQRCFSLHAHAKKQDSHAGFYLPWDSEPALSAHPDNQRRRLANKGKILGRHFLLTCLQILCHSQS